MKDPNNIVFLHIPKNGGTTLYSVMERKYDAQTIFTVREKNHKSTVSEFLSWDEDKRKNIKVLMGHVQYGIHEHLIGPTTYFTFLRKPEDRVLSYYNHVKNRPDHRMYQTIFGNQMTFHEFVRDLNDDDIHNTQAQWISGIIGNQHGELLETALHNMEQHFSFVGLQERYDESILLLSEIFGWGIPYYKHLNKGQYKKQSIPQETLEIIKEKNKADYALYRKTEEEFNARVKKEPLLALKKKRLELYNRLYSSHKINKVLHFFKNQEA